MKRTLIITLTIALFACFQSRAQNEIDSLTKLIQTHGEDTVKVLAYIELSQITRGNQPEKAMEYARKALDLSKKLKYKKGIGFSNLRLGYVHYQFNNFEQALEKFNKAIGPLIDLGEKEQLASLYNTIGIMNYYLANYEQSLRSYLKSKDYYEQIGNRQGVSSAYNNIGIIYNNQDNLDKALEYHFKSLGIDKEIDNQNGIATSYNNIGEIYRAQGKLDKALDYYRKSLEIKESENNETGIAYAYGNVGLIFQEKNNYDTALYYHEKSLTLKEKIGDKIPLIEAYYSMGSFYFHFGNYAKAEFYYLKSLKLSEELGAPEMKKDATEGLAQTYYIRGNYKTAYDYLKRYITISDTIHQKESMKKTTQFELQAEYERREKQMEFEQKQKELAQMSRINRQRIVNYSLLIGMFLLVLLAIVIYRSYKVKKNAASLLEEQKKQIALEKAKSEELLLNILPSRTAEELKKYGRATSKHFEMVTVMFADFVGFTKLGEITDPLDLIYELDYYFSEFDSIIERFKKDRPIEKIKTIGDCYMCAGGIPYTNKSNPFDLVLAGLEIKSFMDQINLEKKIAGLPEWKIRIGIHTGEVVTGVVGTIKFAYDIWGDTVNVASRMESHGEPGRVNISEETYNYVKNYFDCTFRGEIEAKNKGKINMYFVDGIKAQYAEEGSVIFPEDNFLEILNKMNNE